MKYSALVMREGYLTAHTILLVLMIACILRTQELFAVSSFEHCVGACVSFAIIILTSIGVLCAS